MTGGPKTIHTFETPKELSVVSTSWKYGSIGPNLISFLAVAGT